MSQGNAKGARPSILAPVTNQRQIYPLLFDLQNQVWFINM